MATLLARPLDKVEQMLQDSLTRILPKVTHMAFTETLWRSLGLTHPGPYFAAFLSLIQLPPASRSELVLCRYLLAIREFYVYLAAPTTFDRPALLGVCRVFMRIEPRFDVRLISALAEDDSVIQEVFVRMLSVLDEISPGGRLTMTLARVQRDAEPRVASKLAIMMGRRVFNPVWVRTQLSSKNPRTRANVLETLWRVDTPEARKWLLAALADSNNRVVGNALLGLHLLKDDQVESRIQALARHLDPAFRATAAWLIGEVGETRYCPLLTVAMLDSESTVRHAAERALQKFATQAVSSAAEPEHNLSLQPELSTAPDAHKSDDNPAPGNAFDLRLDGSLRQFT